MTTENRARGLGASTPAAVIDLPHLRRYTLGDALLEREILELFAEHAATTLVQLEAAADESARQQGAHALKGSALAVGAWTIASLAQTAEGLAASAKATAPVLVELSAAIGEARDFIEALRNPADEGRA